MNIIRKCAANGTMRHAFLALRLKKQAFSLVELMLSLIIISLIAAAFTPIITKKLKTSSIYAGGGAQQITNKCDDFGDNCELCTKQYCISCNLECDTGQYVDTKICNTCENCPDNCEECESATKCTKCKSGNNGYAPVNGFCTKCEGSTPYSTGTECTSGCVASDGSYCDSSGNIKACSSKFANCATCDNDRCETCNDHYFLDNGKCTKCTNGGCMSCSPASYCTKCQGDWILDESSHDCRYWSGKDGCSCFSGTTSSWTCCGCIGGYYYNASKTCTKCELNGCQTCKSGESASNPKCSNCKGGYYLNSSGECLTCSSKYGTNCATCDSNNCLSCNSGYSMSEDTTGTSSCEENDGTFTCSDSNFMRIGNLCITRKNMGDDESILQIPSGLGIIKVKANADYCYSVSNKCCWLGGGTTNTTNNCNADNGGYSGCTRTVCNWEAANAICANFNYAGKKWRLATASEMSGWGLQFRGLGTNGLQFCDSWSGYSSAVCGYTANYCKGVNNDHSYCMINSVWGEFSDTNEAYSLFVTAGGAAVGTNKKTTSASVRCVTQMND